MRAPSPSLITSLPTWLHAAPGGGLRKTAPRRRAGSLHKAVQPAPPRQQGGVNRIPCPGQCGWSHRDKDDHLDHLALFTAGRMILLPIPCLTSSAVFYIPKDILVLTRQRSCRKRGPNSAAQLTLGSADPQRFFQYVRSRLSSAGCHIRLWESVGAGETSALSYTILCKGPEPLRSLVLAKVLEPTPRRH